MGKTYFIPFWLFINKMEVYESAMKHKLRSILIS